MDTLTDEDLQDGHDRIARAEIRALASIASHFGAVDRITKHVLDAQVQQARPLTWGGLAALVSSVASTAVVIVCVVVVIGLMKHGDFASAQDVKPVAVQELKALTGGASDSFADAVQEYKLEYGDAHSASAEIAKRLALAKVRFSVRPTERGSMTIFVSGGDASEGKMAALKRELLLPAGTRIPFRIVVVNATEP